MGLLRFLFGGEVTGTVKRCSYSVDKYDVSGYDVEIESGGEVRTVKNVYGPVEIGCKMTIHTKPLGMSSTAE